MKNKTLMLQGTMSSAGKSLLVTGLCRLFARRGLRVAPFKSQNMSNNAGVCPDGSEIGRAQYTQALACGLQPTAEMNPILLKPEADSRSQVILMGSPYATWKARTFYQRKAELWESATKALDNLMAAYDLVLIEGAGSPVEMNLKGGDVVNMAVAAYAQSPVLLVGDIDRGGIFAQLLGTLDLFTPEERALVKGLVVNKFRGDGSLFEDGITILEEKGKVPVAGVVPYVQHAIPEEDAVAIERPDGMAGAQDMIDIVIPRLPRIANFDDFDPLRLEPGVQVRYIQSAAQFGAPHAVILPGSKSTISDLLWLRSVGLDEVIQQYAQQGGAVVGICGGYQMLGRSILDPEAVESDEQVVDGLGLIETQTVFEKEKTTSQMVGEISGGPGWLAGVAGCSITGYEIHMGQTDVPPAETFIRILCRGEQTVSILEGAVAGEGRVWGCYIHGLFHNKVFRHAWLSSLGWRADAAAVLPSMEASFDQLADVLERSLDMALLEKIIGL